MILSSTSFIELTSRIDLYVILMHNYCIDHWTRHTSQRLVLTRAYTDYEVII